MSRNVNGVPVIEAEPDLICFMCGKIEETRPYGPNGEEICFDCGMKDKATTERMMGIKLFGEKGETMEFRERFAIEMQASRRCSAYGHNMPHVLHREPAIGLGKTRNQLCPEIERALIDSGLSGQEVIDIYGEHVGTAITCDEYGHSRAWLF